MVVMDAGDGEHAPEYAVSVQGDVGVREHDAGDGVPPASAEHIKTLGDDRRVAAHLDDYIGAVRGAGMADRGDKLIGAHLTHVEDLVGPT